MSNNKLPRGDNKKTGDGKFWWESHPDYACPERATVDASGDPWWRCDVCGGWNSMYKWVSGCIYCINKARKEKVRKEKNDEA